MIVERELNRKQVIATDIPDDVAERFHQFSDMIERRSCLPWAEHCVECALPDCYATCEYYSPRPDLRCRRFANGFKSVLTDRGIELFDIQFKKWGRLEAGGTPWIMPADEAAAYEYRDRSRTNLMNSIPMPYVARVYATRQKAKIKHHHALAATGSCPTGFAAEIFNPGKEEVPLRLGIRPHNNAANGLYQKRLAIAPGYNRILVEMKEIERALEIDQSLIVELSPADKDALPRLIFGTLDFVTLRNAPNSSSGIAFVTRPKVKCVVWDLDNTLWQGILTEDGLEGLALNPQAVSLIKELDARGILQSVASKNDADTALTALHHFGLKDYFLTPQINWEPKSVSVRQVARNLDIGIDTLIFIDDQAFERDEVSQAISDVETVDVTELSTLLDRSRFDVPITTESRGRRQMYIQDVNRRANEPASSDSADYLNFLRDCNINIMISRLTEDNKERVHELTQRTNQMNFSGNRYTRQRIDEIMASSEYESFVISCRDNYGEYGIIGFALMHVPRARMIDLMFSCRIQRKFVDVAAIRHIMEIYKSRGHERFEFVYKRTAKNSPNAKLFDALHATPMAEEPDGVILAAQLSELVPDVGIATLEVAC